MKKNATIIVEIFLIGNPVLLLYFQTHILNYDQVLQDNQISELSNWNVCLQKPSQIYLEIEQQSRLN